MNESLQEILHYIERHEDRLWMRTAVSPLVPLSWLYGAGLNLRWAIQEFRTKTGVPCPVVSVGNLTVGGTGKTPMVTWVAEFLRQKGLRVAIVSHGYGGSEGEAGSGSFVLLKGQEPSAEIASLAGDEAVMLSTLLPDVPVASGRKKTEVLIRAWRKLKPDVMIIDDGFQSISIRRNLDIVTIDATNPWGSGHLLPRGRLREKKENLSRADIVVITRCNQCRDVSGLLNEIGLLTSAPIIKGEHVINSVRKLDTGAHVEPKALAGAGVYAFSAIANPISFERTLRRAGASLVGIRRFRDHHFFLAEDLSEIENEAVFLRAKYLITTEKDSMRLPGAWTLNRGIPLLSVGISIDITEGREKLEGALLGLFAGETRVREY